MSDGLAKVTEKPVAASAALADHVLIIIDGKVYRASLDTLADVLTEAQLAKIQAASDELTDALVAAKTEDAQNAAARAEAAAKQAETLAQNLDVNVLLEKIGSKADNLYYDEENNLLYLTSDGEISSDPVSVSSGSGGGSGGGTATGAIMKLVNKTGAVIIPLASGQDCTVSFQFSSVDNEDQSVTGPGTEVWKLGDEQIAAGSIEQGLRTFTVAASRLKEGSNILKVTVTDAYGTERSLSWTIQVKSISLICELDDTVIYTGEQVIRYTPIGSEVSKETTFEMDGVVIGTATTSDTNLQKSFTLPAQNHGAHTLQMWTTAVIGGVEVSSVPLPFHMIYREDGEVTPVISVKDFGAFTQYSATGIRFQVYHPLTMSATVELAVDGEVVQTLEGVDRDIQTWLYKPMTTGAQVLTISCDGESVSLNIDVVASGVEVSEIIDGLVWKFDPTGRSNSEAAKDQWSDGDVSMAVSEGFHWSHGGWGADEDGYPCFTVPAGDTLTISAQPFTSDWKRAGHLLKFVFKAVNCRKYDAQVMSCMSGGIGVTVLAQNATFKSEQTTVEVPLCENKYTELEFNITSTTNYRKIAAYTQGVGAGGKIYAENDSFIQSAPVPIVIGSPDCDVRIYKMREYSAYLTDEEIFNNWIVDAPSGEEMLDRWVRNQITDDYGNIDPDKLAANCPDLRVITLTCPRFTTGKKDTVQGCTIRHVWKGGGDKHCWTAKGAKHKGQGTSSDSYGDSGRNVDVDATEVGFDLDTGEHIDAYSMTDNSIGEAYFNIKVNVASSENCNNAYLTSEYQRWNPYLRAARQADSRVRDTMEFHPCALFVQDLSGELFGDTKVHFYAAGDFGNSKKNYAAQGLDESNPNECIVELLSNTTEIQRWKSDDLSAENWDGDGSVEFRFPENPTDTMKASFQRVLSWVVSTDATQATNENLPLAVTYGGTEYKVDSADYRKAKFIHEFDQYFVSDSITFYYLFTDRHTMVDNRAKNTFWHTSDGILWDLCFDYDNDTAMGNDNEGGLTLTYGLEDIDSIGTKDVFNAADSVIFCNVRDLLPDRLIAMYQKMETAGAWDKDRILSEMEAYQAVKPERLWNADFQRKYWRPYEEKGITSYIPMHNGKKTLQRAQFQTYQAPYCNSKYQSAKCTADIITIRAYTPTNYTGVKPSGNLKITMYADCYIVVVYDTLAVKVRAKRGEVVEVKSPMTTLNDTPVYICTASLVQAVGDLSAAYIGYSNWGMAEKLQEVVISEYSSGYSNTNMTGLDLGNCKLLRRLVCCCAPNLASSMTFTGCPFLEEVDMRGSGIVGVTFAEGGLIASAMLPATLTSIEGKRLDALESLLLEGYTNLRKLHLEYCDTVNSLQIVTYATNLTRARLLGVNWVSENAEAMIRLCGVGGIDDSGFDVENAVVTGLAHIGALSQTKLDTLNAEFPDLSIIYDSITEEHHVYFVDEDQTTILDTQLVEHGYGAENPITRKVNPISTPTKPSTEWYDYPFAGWSGSYTTIIQDTYIVATYQEKTRQYNAKWMNGLDLVQEKTIDAGGSAVYEGPDLEKTGYIWTGWDALVTNVLSDIVVNATFEAPELPAEKLDTTQYDYVYSDDPADNAAYTFGQLAGIISSGLAGEYFNMYDKVKIVNVGTAIKDESLVLSLHSLKHFELADDSGDFAKTTWFMEGVFVSNRQMNTANTNVGGYFETPMDNWIENTLFPSLPCHWRSIIKPVYVLANAGDQSTTINKKSRHLYLPSWAELGIETSAVPYKNEVDANANEIQFSKYTGNAQRIKKTYNGEGSAQTYWTRSAYAGSSSSFCIIYSNGNSANRTALISYAVCVGLSI